MAEVKCLLEKRFAEIAARYAGQIHCMEVINETLLWYDEWKDQGRWSTQFFFEDDLVEWSFQCARKYFPQHELIINEATEQAWDVHAAGRSAYSAVISDSIRKGAVIDGIGLQYHLFYSKEREAEQACPLLSPKRLYGCMDHYWNRYHKPLQVTEVTIPAYSNSAEDEALQAEVLEKLFTIWFSHPAMEAAIYWNLVDGYAAFAPQGDMTAGENYYHGGLIHFDMTHKPAYDMMNELFHHRFRTEADGQDGYELVVHCASNRAKAKETRKLIEEKGGKAAVVTGDLTDPCTAERLMAETGPLDALVLDASMQIRRPWQKISLEKYQKQMTCNFYSSLRLIQLAVPHMKAQKWGRIVTIGSVQERKPHPDMLVYSASKAAQTNRVQSLAQQLAADGITVNNVAPGVIFTARNVEALSDPTYAAEVTVSIPAGFYGEPRDCAGVVRLLLSDAARYITGQSIYVDGGKSL